MEYLNPARLQFASGAGGFRCQRAMKPPRYIAQLRDVREVALLGTANLQWWTDKLRSEDLSPAAEAGRAVVLISGIASRYMGLSFRELIIAVFTASSAEDSGRDGAYLVHAF